MARRKPGAKPADEQVSALSKLFDGIGSKSARAVLPPVQAVPTRFLQLDWATRVGGWPIQRCAIVHGPSNEGKTALMIGLLGSFVEGGHVGDLVDAERTTTAGWCEQLIGATARSDRFRARRPDTYEQCVDETRKLHRLVRDRRGIELAANASCLTVIDSLRKLVPEDVFAKIKKHGASGEKGSVDGMGGRAAQIKAALNAAWLDELIPQVDSCGTAWVAIVRETEDPNASAQDHMYGNDYKITGGKAVFFDSALVLRVERDRWIAPYEDKKIVLGERHRITIRKTKVGGKEDRAAVCYFHTSNGREYDYGFDPARDAIELALRLGVMKLDGSWLSWPTMGPKAKWQGQENAVTALRGASGDLEQLQLEVRTKFGDAEPPEKPEEM